MGAARAAGMRLEGQALVRYQVTVDFWLESTDEGAAETRVLNSLSELGGFEPDEINDGYCVREITEKPTEMLLVCPLCGVERGDPHNTEAHLVEMRYEEDPSDREQRWYDKPDDTEDDE
jgi:hypothetical protein